MNTEQVYAVFKIGVYRHECGGIFTNLELAVAAAKKLQFGERDNYHCYEVVPFELNRITEQVPVVEEENFGYFEGKKLIRGGDLIERKPIWTSASLESK